MVGKRNGMNYFIGFNICSKSKFPFSYSFIIGCVMFPSFKVHRMIKTTRMYMYISVHNCCVDFCEISHCRKC
jgi:hypothetical protein